MEDNKMTPELVLDGIDDAVKEARGERWDDE